MNSLTKGFMWKLMERFGAHGIQFIMQIILARILSPEHYGVLSLMLIFVSVSNTFVQSGFNTALIQNKDVTEEDYSSVFWVSLLISIVLYGVIFVAAPYIGIFYDMPELVVPLRVLALVIIPGAVNSIQLAKISRTLDFKKAFWGNLGGIVISGIIGIVMANKGMGLWALVVQSILNTLISCVIMLVIVDWFPKWGINWTRIGILFSYGWKLLMASLLDTFYQELRSLIIGKKYDEITLGYYNKGKQFPQLVINAVNGTVQSVMLPVMSAKQDDRNQIKLITRNSIMLSSFILFPVMAGLAGIANSVVELLLTDKWILCVPYMQIYCFTFAFYPIHSCNLQAINALGRSEVFLKLEIIKKIVGVLAIAIAVWGFSNPIAIALTGTISGLINCFINAYPNKRLIGYSYFEQMKDIFPSLVIALIMLAVVLAVEKIGMGIWLTLTIQIVVGCCCYIGLAALCKLQPYIWCMDILKKIRSKE